MAGDIIEDGAGGAANGALRSHPPNLSVGAPQQSLHSRLGDLAAGGGQRFSDYQQQQHLPGNDQVFSTKVEKRKSRHLSCGIVFFFCRSSSLQAAWDIPPHVQKGVYDLVEVYRSAAPLDDSTKVNSTILQTTGVRFVYMEHIFMRDILHAMKASGTGVVRLGRAASV